MAGWSGGHCTFEPDQSFFAARQWSGKQQSSHKHGYCFGSCFQQASLTMIELEMISAAHNRGNLTLLGAHWYNVEFQSFNHANLALARHLSLHCSRKWWPCLKSYYNVYPVPPPRKCNWLEPQTTFSALLHAMSIFAHFLSWFMHLLGIIKFGIALKTYFSESINNTLIQWL